MIIRDPVHGLIELSGPAAPVLRDLLDTREVQRLRRIRQLGVTSLAFPGAEHSRFSHSLGAAHVMGRLLRTLASRADPPVAVGEREAVASAAAALLHDVGHGPLSHLLQAALPDGPKHEHWSVAVVRSEATEVGRALDRHGLREDVARLVEGTHEAAYLCDALSSPLDVDRFDYLLRDSHYTGVRYGVFDLDWMLSSLLLAEAPTPTGDRVVLAVDGRRGLRAVEGYLMARLSMFQQVYFHKTSRAAELMVAKALRRAGTLAAAGGLPEPLPPALATLVAGGTPRLEDYLALDDHALWHCLHRWAESSDPILSALSSGLMDRRLLRTLPLAGRADEAEVLARVRQATAEAGFDPDYFCGLDRAVDVPYHVDPGASERIWVVGLGRPRPLAEVSPIVEVLRGWQVGRSVAICPEAAREALGRVLT